MEEPSTSKETCDETDIETVAVPPTDLLNLPEEVLEYMLRCLTFSEVSKSRLVCKRFDQICQHILNKTFFKLQNRMLQRFQLIKNKMPRRESLRRKHPLARECDIVETLHMRLTLLQMTFGKHIERKHCCFFPGEVLDEIYRILRYIKTTESPARAYKVTDELFDLSTMALEFFKEHIEGNLPEINYFSNLSEMQDITNSLPTPPTKTIQFSLPVACDTPQPSTSSKVVLHQHPVPYSPAASSLSHYSNKITNLRNRVRSSNIMINHLRKELKSCKAKMEDQQRQIAECNSKLEQHGRQFAEQDRKFNALVQEVQTYKAESRSPSSGTAAEKTTIKKSSKTRLKGEDDCSDAHEGPSQRKRAKHTKTK